jgi:hypothetical protein
VPGVQPTEEIGLQLSEVLGFQPTRVPILGPLEVFGFLPLILAADVTVVDNHIDWVPSPTLMWKLQWLFKILGKFGRNEPLLAHLTLKGNFIWEANSQGLPMKYLDGEAFGQPANESNRIRTGLRSEGGRLSGDCIRGGDFEMWFWVTPSAISFGRVRLGRSADAPATVTNTSNEAFTVTAVNTAAPFSVIGTDRRLPAVLKPGESLTATIQFTPTAPTPEDREEVGEVVFVTDPSAILPPIGVRGRGGPPNIDVQPSALDFGDVEAKSTSTQGITVRNTGNTKLEATASVGKPFTVSPDRFTLDPDGEQHLTLTFEAPARGKKERTGVLTITSNDPDNPTVTIQLSGKRAES